MTTRPNGFRCTIGGKVYELRKRGPWLVVTGGGKPYHVTLSADSCSCPGFIFGANRGELRGCRHINMARLAKRWIAERGGCYDCASFDVGPGRGRCYGETPHHVYCRRCNTNLTWHRQKAVA